MWQAGCAALPGFTWLNYQPGNPALLSVVCGRWPSSVRCLRGSTTQQNHEAVLFG